MNLHFSNISGDVRVFCFIILGFIIALAIDIIAERFRK